MSNESTYVQVVANHSRDVVERVEALRRAWQAREPHRMVWGAEVWRAIAAAGLPLIEREQARRDATPAGGS